MLLLSLMAKHWVKDLFKHQPCSTSSRISSLTKMLIYLIVSNNLKMILQDKSQSTTKNSCKKCLRNSRKCTGWKQNQRWVSAKTVHNSIWNWSSTKNTFKKWLATIWTRLENWRELVWKAACFYVLTRAIIVGIIILRPNNQKFT